ncbi:MAG TPA: type I methionyl aminopeptidase [Tepidisphaeraceae bacterium]|jgi:methionyl aminopeptidase
MPILIKSRSEIEKMRRAGHIGYTVLQKMREAVRPGVTTDEINAVAAEELARFGAVGMSKNYPTYKPGEGYPSETCISVNEEIVHGIPGPRKLKEGDVVTLDVTPQFEGYVADTAITVPVGPIHPQAQKLLDVTKDVLDLSISLIKPGKLWSEIARLVQYNVEKAGFSVVREFVGHGVGKKMHEDPKVPNFVTAEQLRSDFKLRPGMTLAVEPMVVIGRREVLQLEDAWTIISADRSYAAHFEHTIAVTDTGVDVLTDGRAAWGV